MLTRWQLGSHPAAVTNPPNPIRPCVAVVAAAATAATVVARRRSANLMWVSAGTLALSLVGGCTSGLETGYTPRALGVSTAERRAYYASPYTPEAAAADQAKQNAAADNPAARRPNLGPRQY